MASLVESATDIGKSFGPRFLRVGLIPASLLVVLFGGLIGARAPASRPDLHSLADSVAKLSGADLVALAAVVVAVALVLQPLQLGLVRLLEGYWPQSGPLGEVTRRFTNHQEKRSVRVRSRTTVSMSEQDPRVLEAAQSGARRWMAEFPPTSDRILPTRLGNAMRAAEDRAGRPYGMDAVTAWPRLYSLLPERFAVVIDDRRDQLDISARLVGTFALGAIGTFALLVAHGGWWLILPAGLAVLSWLSYLGALSAAIAYGEALCAAFDLHRFDLLKAIHVPLPGDGESERAIGIQMTRLWSLRGPSDVKYHHDQ